MFQNQAKSPLRRAPHPLRFVLVNSSLVFVRPFVGGKLALPTLMADMAMHTHVHPPLRVPAATLRKNAQEEGAPSLHSITYRNSTSCAFLRQSKAVVPRVALAINENEFPSK